MHAARLLLMHCLCTLWEKGVTVGPEDYKLTSKLDLAGVTLPFILAQIIINIIFWGDACGFLFFTHLFGSEQTKNRN